MIIPPSASRTMATKLREVLSTSETMIEYRP